MQNTKIFSTELEAQVECDRRNQGNADWFCPMIDRNCIGQGGKTVKMITKPCLCYQPSMVFQILNWEGVPKPAWKVTPARCTNVSLVGEEL